MGISGPIDETDLIHRDRLHTSLPDYRSLTQDERRILEAAGNTAESWDRVVVAAGFDAHLVRNCDFCGTVRIGALSPGFLKFHDLSLPIGLDHALIVSCDIGDNCVIRNVGYLSRYVLDREVTLFNIDEMGATDHVKFGNGLVMEGEPEEVRIWLEIANENGGRAILPFDGIETGDAALWSHHRSYPGLDEACRRMTESMFSTLRGAFGHVGKATVIKSCRIVKDVKFGSFAYVKGANKLKNLTINSDEEAPTQIGEGVELVNGIIERGCRVFYGVKAVRFVMRTNSCLKYGARLINAILGDNGTISCCEVLNSLVMPGHEQHHNNSFLCAATLLGQSNIAAGATIGSNHNSRANDGEIVAGRGFWPGLAVSLKHSSKFGSFSLIAKGSYPAELNMPLAFTLVATGDDHLILRPAFWFLHNMYALARNSWKYGDRDKRWYRYQRYEYDYLAPDTVDEIITTLEILEYWSGLLTESIPDRITFSPEAFGGVPDDPEAFGAPWNSTRERGRTRLAGDDLSKRIVISGAGFEKSSRPVEVYDLARAWNAYRMMVALYAVKTICAAGGNTPLTHLLDKGAQPSSLGWRNLGGQLVRVDEYDRLLSEIASGNLSDWHAVHARYREIGERYEEQRLAHALSTLSWIVGEKEIDSVSRDQWERVRSLAAEGQRLIERETRESRSKDYGNRFRMMMYDSPEEMDLVVGSLEENSFVSVISEQTREILSLIGE